MQNVNYKKRSLLKQRKMNKIKTVKNSFKVLNLPVRGKTANYIDFVQPMLISCSCFFSSLDGDIRKVSKILFSRNWFELFVILYQHVCQFESVCMQT